MRWPWSMRQEPVSEATGGPGSIELLPGLDMSFGELEYECMRGRVLALEFATQGLMQLGQKELWVSVAEPPGQALEAVVSPMIGFIRAVHEMARQGRTVDVGGASSLSPESPPMVGGSDFRAAIYTYPIGAGMDELATRTSLSVILLTLEELEIAQQYGQTRFLSSLGQYYRYFPTPPWADPARPQVLSRDSLESSLIGETMRVAMYRSSSIVEADESNRRLFGHTGDFPDHKSSAVPTRTRLSVHPDESRLLVEALDTSEGKTPVTLLTSIKPGIERSMVWTGREDQVQVISDMSLHSSAIGCNFTMLASEQDETGAQIFEDGQLVHLTQAAWKDLVAAVKAGSPFSLTGEGELADFDLAWNT